MKNEINVHKNSLFGSIFYLFISKTETIAWLLSAFKGTLMQVWKYPFMFIFI